jgi:putative hydrolase of HD superfamily
MSCNNNDNYNNSAHQSSPPTADAAGVDAVEVANARNTIDFLTMTRGLKTTPRTGWVLQKAGPRIESVADHSWRISLMAMVASSPSISSSTTSTTQQYDTNRCIKMALVHDLAEATVGDITPHCGVSDTTKHELELRAITEMTQKLTIGLLSTVDDVSSSSSSSNIGVGNEILELWKEYEEGVTDNAKLVKDMDKLEMILQALEYENDGKNEKSLDG